MQDDFSDELKPEMIVEHLSVPGFLRRVPHRWALDDIARFGDKVGRMAEAMQIAYVTTKDIRLGVLRIFPVPLLQRVYEIMAAQFHWPAVPSTPLLEGPDMRRKNEETLRSHLRAINHLREVLSLAEDAHAVGAMTETLRWLEADSERLRQSLEESPAENAVSAA